MEMDNDDDLNEELENFQPISGFPDCDKVVPALGKKMIVILFFNFCTITRFRLLSSAMMNLVEWTMSWKVSC